MDRTELERAAIEGLPVVYESRVHGYRILGQVTAVIDRYALGGSFLSAELKDIYANSSYLCDPRELSVWDGCVDKSAKIEVDVMEELHSAFES